MMKEKFKECMKYLYPIQAVTDPQLLDLIRVFSMGWAESIKFHINEAAAIKWVNEYSYLKNENWVPDDSWKW